MKNLLRKSRALFYKFLYRNPSAGMMVIGITGTDGKSTTSEMLYQLSRAAGFSTGLVSTIGGKINDEAFDTGLHTSTPSSKAIYAALAKMRKARVSVCILELTSHGLDQGRAYGIVLDGAVYTNISHEHLDYHKTFESYKGAKASMMRMLKPGGVVILNQDDSNVDFLKKYALALGKNIAVVSYHMADGDEKVRFGLKEKIYIAHHIVSQDDGYTFEVQMQNLSFPVRLHMHGEYNISNALAAMSASIMLGMPVQGVVKGIENVRSIPGRMDIVQEEPVKIIVDFAHTPNGMQSILSYFKSVYPTRRLIVMFGCAGRRDASKRPIMGATASSLADIIVLTSEDPRDEDINQINKEIASGIDMKKFALSKNLFVIQSREEAIQYILTTLAQKGDVVLFLGKGHEKSNCIGDIEYPWNEVATVKKYMHV